jgi:hypothetical protein
MLVVIQSMYMVDKANPASVPEKVVKAGLRSEQLDKSSQRERDQILPDADG